MAESADARDLKSLAGNSVTVQVCSAAPARCKRYEACSELFYLSDDSQDDFQTDTPHLCARAMAGFYLVTTFLGKETKKLKKWTLLLYVNR